jgi:hypothetical protein
LPILRFTRGEALGELGWVAILETSLLLENRPFVLDVDTFLHEQR